MKTKQKSRFLEAKEAGNLAFEGYKDQDPRFAKSLEELKNKE